MTTTIQMNARGTLTLPKAFRRMLGLDKGGSLLADVSEGRVLLKPSVTFPIEIYTDARVAEFDQADTELAHRLRRKRR